MADMTINGTAYSSTPTSGSGPYKPTGLTRERIKVGVLKEAANGTLTWMHRGFKWRFTLSWDKANPTTEAAVLALRNLTTTFTYVDFNGTSYTVLTVGEDGYSEDVTTDRANAYRFDLSIVLREA